MSRFHISRKGEPADCHAGKVCPLGEDTPHFDTKEQAWEYFHETHKETAFNTLRKRTTKILKNAVITATAASFVFSLSGCKTDIRVPESVQNQATSAASKASQKIDEAQATVNKNNETSSNSSASNTNNSDSSQTSSTKANSRKGKTPKIDSNTKWTVSEGEVDKALADLATIPIKDVNWKEVAYDRKHKIGDYYQRKYFGTSWKNLGGDSCDTKSDIRRRDMTNKVYKTGNKCIVVKGTLDDMYTGKIIFYDQSVDDAAVQVDHKVPLGNAWQMGMKDIYKTNPGMLIKFANDPRNLRLVDGPTNVQKSDSDYSQWKIPNVQARGVYADEQVEIKKDYGLAMTQAEHDAIQQTLEQTKADFHK